MFTKIKNFVKKAWKKLLIVFGVASVVTAGILGAPQILPIPEHEILKTDKENIILFKEFKEKKEIKYYYKKLAQEILWEDNEIDRHNSGRVFYVKSRQANSAEIAELRAKNPSKFNVPDNQIVIEIYHAKILSGGPHYFQEPDGKWYKVDSSTTTPRSFNKQTSGIFGIKKALALTTSTVSTSDDGLVAYSQSGQDWGIIHGAGTGTADTFTSTESGAGFNRLQSHTSSNKWNYIGRGIVHFDTTIVPNDATTVSSTIAIKTNADGGSDPFSESFNWVSFTEPSTSPGNGWFASSSYGTTSFAAISIGTLAGSANTWFNFVLNADGRSYLDGKIAAATSTAFGGRSDSDMTNTPPTWASDQTGLFGAYYSETANSEPVIHIEYTIPTVAGVPAVPPIIIHYD